MNRLQLTFVLPAFVLLFSATNTSAHILNVPEDYQTIQSGIDSAEAGDTVLVQPGVYEENTIIQRSLVLASLALTTGDPAYVDSTVIDAGGRDRAINIYSVENGAIRIHGFLIRNGVANNMEEGGGIYMGVSNVILERLKMTGNRGAQGGAIGSTSAGSLTVTDCELLRNVAGDGGAMHVFCQLTMNRVLIANNRAGNLGGGAELASAQASVRLDHVTFVDNQARRGGAFDLLVFGGGSLTTNCIVYGNTQEDQSQIYINNNNNGIPYNITYCNIEGGVQSISFQGQINDEEILDADPLFVNPDEDDYHLSDNSPCIDTGDPDSELDPDGSRADIGAFPWVPEFYAFLGGQVLDSETDQPIAGAVVSGRSGGQRYEINAESDSVGVWGNWFRTHLFDSLAAFQFEFTATGYLPDSIEMGIAIGDSNWIETLLNHGEMTASQDNLSVEVDSSGSGEFPVSIFNPGNGLLTWRAIVSFGENAGFSPWMLRSSLPVSQITRDERIEGVIFDGESYYCAGSNGDDPNMIYHLNRAGELLDSIRQPGFSHYGFSDLEWDGELIWGSDGDAVYGLSRNGNVEHAWQAPFFPTNNVAYDPEEAILWISGSVSDIKAYDREGNYLDRTLSRQGLRLYGLAWYGDDPDSSFLYALNYPFNDTAQINKFNPISGEMSLVYAFPLDSATGFNGTFICRNYDRYQGWVMMTVANIPMASGGDALRVYQLEPNREWLTVHPESGEIPPGESAEVEIRVRTAGWDGSWAFDIGEYVGEIIFRHNGQGGWDILPVQMSVVEPNDMDRRTSEQVDKFELSAAYPNPFNPSTTIKFALLEDSKVRLTVYDLAGREVATLVNGELKAGAHSATWIAEGFTSGIYLVKMETPKFSATRKVTLVK